MFQSKLDREIGVDFDAIARQRDRRLDEIAELELSRTIFFHSQREARDRRAGDEVNFVRPIWAAAV